MTTENNAAAVSAVPDIPDADAFAAAFVESLTLDAPVDTKSVPDAVKDTTTAEPAPDVAKDTTTADPTPDAVKDTTTAEPAPDAAKGTTTAEPAPEPAPTAADIARVAAEAATKAITDAQAAAEAARDKGATDDKPFYTKEEQDAIVAYHKDWPDVAQAEALIRRQEYTKIVGHVFAEVARELAPIFEWVGETQESMHDQTLIDAHPDYTQIYDGCTKWINTQPEYLKNLYTRVAKEGTAGEVVDMISRYKESAGIKPADGTTKRTTVVVEGKQGAGDGNDASAKAKEAAAKLSVVGTKRTAVGTTAADPNDFSGAFEEAVSQAG